MQINCNLVYHFFCLILLQLVDYLFRIISTYLESTPSSFQCRIGALYALYAIYHTQLCQPKVKVIYCMQFSLSVLCFCKEIIQSAGSLDRLIVIFFCYRFEWHYRWWGTSRNFINKSLSKRWYRIAVLLIPTLIIQDNDVIGTLSTPVDSS